MDNQLQNKVSIIIPIYNGEKVLERCLDSIVNQNYKEWELILVNDGSKDRSLDICMRYSKNDERIHVIDKNNEGVSATRNRGIQEATGEYIQFVDCDDYVSKDYLENMVMCLETKKSDLVIGGYTRFKHGKTTKCTPKPMELKGVSDIAEHFFELYNHWFLNTPWNKLYKRDKIKSGYPLDLSLGEDLIFNLEYLKQCEHVSVVDEAGYQYQIIENSGSLAEQFREDRFGNSMYLHNQIIDFAKCYLNMTDEKQWKDESFVKQIRFAMTSLMRADNLTQKKKKQMMNQWAEIEEVKAAYRRCTELSKKDIIFKICVCHGWTGFLRILMKVAG